MSSPRATSRPPAAPNRARLMALLLLLAILVVGATLRFTGLNWDDGKHLHPDERFLTMVENGLDWPESLREYFDTSLNPLNPYNRGFGSYVYGVLPVYVTKAVGQLAGLTGYDGVYLAGRAVSAVMDLLCVVLVYAIGARLYDRRVGLLGALFLSLAALSIQQSHYFTVDTTTTFLVTLALYLSVSVAQGDRWRDRIGLGIVFGLAVACKISVLTFGLVIALAFGLAAFRQGASNAEARTRARRLGRYRLRGEVRDLAPGGGVTWDWLALKALELLPAALVVGALALLAFRVAQPQAFKGPGFLGVSINPQWKDDMAYVQKLVSGEIDYPPSHQWAGREPVWYMWKNLVLWGLGVPLGLSVWAGWALMAWELLQRKSAHLLPWVWMTLTFFYQSIQFVKAMRYILPIYPTMALVGAYGLVRLWDWANGATRAAGPRRRGERWLGRGVVGLAVVGTVAWALAFTSIYTRPVTRITASRWVNANIPLGASTSFELWDDPVPMNVDGRLASDDYHMIRMEPYWEDVPEKREMLLQWLDETDYIILSSNRLYGSIPRLEQRFPMTTRYYEMLFSGELGYEQLAEFVARPRLFGLEIADDNADESFTVYDHPKVTIFRKTPRFDLAAIRAEFETFDLEHVVRVMPRQLAQAPNQLMLTDDALVEQRTGGTWSSLYARGSLANRLPTLFWLLALYAVQLAAWPLLAGLAGSLPDAGHGLSKAFGLLLVAYLSWLLPSVGLASYSAGVVWLSLGLVVALSAVQLWRHGAALRDLVRRRWRLLLCQEALFLALFVALWLLRRANPDLWHPVVGGEKPMDFAYLNAVLKSSTFPPYDPWFAGGAMNYYYFGWVIVGALVKLTGILPAVAYNLALPTLFALLGVGVASVVHSLASRGDEDGHWAPWGWRVGLVGVALVCVLGNLGELQLLAQGLISLGGARTVPGTPALGRLLAGLWAKVSEGARLPFRDEWWYWNATRVMGHGEINEFPFFGYLYGDLHAHVMGLPFTVLALGLAINLMRRVQAIAAVTAWRTLTSVGAWLRWIRSQAGALLAPVGALALALGALWCINTWDWPTYTGIAALALVIGALLGAKEGRLRALLAAGGLAMVIVVLGRALFQPYHAHYGMGYAKIARWHGEHTPLGAMLIIYALPLYVLGAYFARRALLGALGPVLRYWRMQRRYGRARVRRLAGVFVAQDLPLDALAVLLVLALLVMVVAFIDGQWTLLAATPLGLLALCEALTAPTAERRLVAICGGAAMALMVFVDWFVLGGDVGRMNTVFKFSLQAWVLAGIAMAVACSYLLSRPARWGWLPRTILVVLLLAAALYPPFATYGRSIDRWPEVTYRGLDGSAYMAEATYQDGENRYILANDQAAIAWLQDNVKGSPVIAEATTPLYRWGSRVSVYTGLPTILGWDWHQRQQRSAFSGEVVDWRIADVDRLFTSPDPAEALAIIARYDVALIYVGEVERAYYDAAGMKKFDDLVGSALTIAYQRGPVTIYRVIGADVLVQSGAAAGPSALRDWLERHVIFGSVRAEGPADAQVEDAGARLLLDQPVDTLPVAAIGWNRIANAHWPLAVLGWYAALQLLGWGAFGLLAPAFRGLDDRGHGLGKGLGLVLVSYLVWLPASLGLPANTSGVIWAVVGGLAVAGALVAWRSGALRGVSWRAVVTQEALFGGAFLALVVVRLLNPDLWQPWFGGEKLMESAFFQAVARSETMPPYDPYFAGGQLNYYYLGLFQANIPLKLVGLRPEIAFNLAVPTLFALAASQAFWAGRQLYDVAGLRRNWRAGAMAVTLVALAGNMTSGVQPVEQVMQLSERAGNGLAAFGSGLARLADGARLPDFDYWWRATRVIPYTINEFPFFGFLFADLHPHLTALPLTVLVIGLLVAVVRGDKRQLVPLGLLSALVYGALGPANTWDLPAYGLAVLGAGLIWAWTQGGRRALALGLAWGAGVVMLGLALYAPFFLRYQAQGLGVGWVAASARSPLANWAEVWGFFMTAVAAMLLAALGGWLHPVTSARSPRARLVTIGLLALVVGAGLGLAAWGLPVLGLLLPLFVAAILLWLRDRAQSTVSLTMMLLVLGLGLLAGVEVVYLKDFLAGSDWSRMNTVFKFHLQAWVLLGIGLGAAWPRLMAALRSWRWPGRAVQGVLWAALGVALLYPLLGTPVRVAERMPYGQPPRWTLDGVAFMATGAYDWPDADHRIELRYDLEAIRWLQANAVGNAVVAEAPIGYYREGGLRVSSFTGLPTLVGMHQGEQRPWTQVTPRQRDADALYTATDAARVAEILQRQGVSYLYYGQLERVAFPQGDGSAFAALEAQGLLERVFANERTVIWAYRPELGREEPE